MANPDFDALIDDFAFIDDWEERYKYVLELGKAMPTLAADEQTEANRVHGCVSQVWLKSWSEGEGDQTKICFLGDSDALIVRGLIAVLRVLMHDRPAGEVAGLDAKAALASLGLDEHLTQQRSNGLFAMIQRLQADAARFMR